MQINTLLYQCTNLSSSLIQQNENLSKAQRQLEKDINDIQEQIAETHQRYEQTLFRIMKVIVIKDSIERQLLINKNNKVIQEKQNQVEQYAIQKDLLIQEVKQSFEQLNKQKN